MSLHFLKIGAKEVWDALPPFQLGMPLASPTPMMSLMYGIACTERSCVPQLPVFRCPLLLLSSSFGSFCVAFKEDFIAK